MLALVHVYVVARMLACQLSCGGASLRIPEFERTRYVGNSTERRAVQRQIHIYI